MDTQDRIDKASELLVKMQRVYDRPETNIDQVLVQLLMAIKNQQIEITNLKRDVEWLQKEQ